jgi:hypothetical protein
VAPSGVSINPCCDSLKLVSKESIVGWVCNEYKIILSCCYDASGNYSWNIVNFMVFIILCAVNLVFGPPCLIN